MSTDDSSNGRLRIAAAALLAGILVGVSGTAAVATTAYSSWQEYVSGVYDFSDRTFVSNDGTKPGGGTQITSSPAAPAAWMAASARLYRNNALCGSATTYYSTQTQTLLARSVAKSCGAGNYRGSGLTYAYRNGAYISHQPDQSPIVVW